MAARLQRATYSLASTYLQEQVVRIPHARATGYVRTDHVGSWQTSSRRMRLPTDRSTAEQLPKLELRRSAMATDDLSHRSTVVKGGRKPGLTNIFDGLYKTICAGRSS